MITYELNNITGWLSIPTTVKLVIAHYKDGHSEEMTLLDFVCLKPKIKKLIEKIDCYDELDKKGETK